MARLIIVEDNSDLASLIASAARARGHTVTVAPTGNAALQALRDSTFEAALVDLLLPDIRGADVLDALRMLGVPAVAMSGTYKGEQFARDAVEAHGATLFFEKPFDMGVVLKCLEAVANDEPEPAAAELIIDEDEDDDLEILPLEEVAGEEEAGEDEPLMTPQPAAPKHPAAASPAPAPAPAQTQARKRQEDLDEEEEVLEALSEVVFQDVPEETSPGIAVELEPASAPVPAPAPPPAEVAPQEAFSEKALGEVIKSELQATPPQEPEALSDSDLQELQVGAPEQTPGSLKEPSLQDAILETAESMPQEDGEEPAVEGIEVVEQEPLPADTAEASIDALGDPAPPAAAPPAEPEPPTVVAPAAVDPAALAAAADPDDTEVVLSEEAPQEPPPRDTAEDALDALGDPDIPGFTAAAPALPLAEAVTAASDELAGVDLDDLEEPPTRPGVAPILDIEPTTPTRELERRELEALAQGTEPAHVPAVVQAAELAQELGAAQAEETAQALAASPAAQVDPVPPPVPEPELLPPVPELSPRESEAIPPESKLITEVELELIDEDPAPTPAPAAPDAGDHDVVLPFAERGRVWAKADEGGRKKELPEWGQAGDLARTSVPKLLTTFHAARASGELKLKHDALIKVIYFEEGQPVFAASNLATERFGRFCLRRGLLDEANLARVAALCEFQHIRTGEAMIRLNIITEEQRQALLEEQVREIIWSTFTWTTGQYSLVSRKPSRQDVVKLRISTGELIKGGIASTFTLLTLRQRMPAQKRLHPAADPPFSPQDLSLTEQQSFLLEHADGSKTVEDLLTLADLSERESLAALASFELMGLLVERRDEGKRQRISFGL